MTSFSVSMSTLCCSSFVTAVELFIICMLLLSQSLHGTSVVRSYKTQQCVYNIYLTDDNGSHSSNIRRRSVQSEPQNDNVDQADSMEKTASFLKEERDRRLENLESTVKDLLDVDSPSSFTVHSTDGMTARLPNQGRALNEDVLTRLYAELGTLKKALKHKTDELLEEQVKVNETEARFAKAQNDLLNVNENLFNAENQISLLQSERTVLKNELRDRVLKLETSAERMKECEAKTTEQEGQIERLMRSENNLSERLRKCDQNLTQTSADLQQLGVRQKDLKARHARTRQILGIRERELIDCYGAKTQTFCGFENSHICGFTQPTDSSDFFDWEWGKGKTPSRLTGPSADHTCGTNQGHFMYIEASAKARGMNAIIYSPLYRSLTQQCLEFFYHMNGMHMGTLNVYAKARGSELASVWRAFGNQGDIWSVARLSIPKQLARAGYQIVFEGITENGYQGDMAIDDVSVTDGSCRSIYGVKTVKIRFNDTNVIVEGKKFARNLRKLRLDKVRRRSSRRRGRK